MEIEFLLEVKNSIVTGICSESGSLDPKCFDSALEFVKSSVESRFFADFLQSEFNAKHEVIFIQLLDALNLFIVTPITKFLNPTA